MWRHPTSQFGVRITTHVLQPHLYVVFLFAMKGHRKRALLQGVGCVLPYSVRCDSEFHFQGTYVETEKPLTTASFVLYVFNKKTALGIGAYDI